MERFYRELYKKANLWLEDNSVGLWIYIPYARNFKTPKNKYNIKIQKPPFPVERDYRSFEFGRIGFSRCEISTPRFRKMSEEEFIGEMMIAAGEGITAAWEVCNIEKGMNAKNRRHLLEYRVTFPWKIAFHTQGVGDKVRIHTSNPAEEITFLKFPIFPYHQAMFYTYSKKDYLEHTYNNYIKNNFTTLS